MTTDKMMDLVGASNEQEVRAAFDGKTVAEIKAELDQMFAEKDNCGDEHRHGTRTE